MWAHHLWRQEMTFRTFTAATIRHAAGCTRQSAETLATWCGMATNPDAHADTRALARERAQFADYLDELARDAEPNEVVTVATRRDHNGWTNYETWMVKLWLDNDAASYATAHALPLLYSLDTGALAAQLKSLAEDLTLGDGAASLATDLINSALAEVNWQEIARHIDEEARDNG
jgi:hypothetical protein